jgi:hypothetical protein
MGQYAGPKALTQLGDDEQLFRDTVRRFAGEEIAPLVRGMDKTQQMDAGLIGRLFGVGRFLMRFWRWRRSRRWTLRLGYWWMCRTRFVSIR